DGRSIPGRAGRAANFCVVTQGGRHRLEPHARVARVPFRPLVESGRRGPGDRSRAPPRADAAGAGAQARGRGGAGGADRRADQEEARHRGGGHRQRRGVAHRAVDDGAARAGRARRRRRFRHRVRRGVRPMKRGPWYRDPWSGRRYEPARPRAVAGGIKDDVRGRASFQSWWARRWIEMLEQFGQGARLSRGRSYARLGQVRSLASEPGRITAVVQGTRPAPYNVTISLPVFAPERWRAAIRELPGQLLAAARLLSGDVCAELETAFRDARASLLPEHSRD